jgi:transcriptional regulator with XRE-family HTH domain
MTPGTWIKRLRITKQLKQTTIANRMGITQQAYSKIENAEWITKGKLPRVLDALDSDFDELQRVANFFKWKENETMMMVAEDLPKRGYGKRQ